MAIYNMPGRWEAPNPCHLPSFLQSLKGDCIILLLQMSTVGLRGTCPLNTGHTWCIPEPELENRSTPELASFLLYKLATFLLFSWHFRKYQRYKWPPSLSPNAHIFMQELPWKRGMWTLEKVASLFLIVIDLHTWCNKLGLLNSK